MDYSLRKINMNIEVSNGEILDKLSILEIKLKYITDINKTKNITTEYLYIQKISKNIFTSYNIASLYEELTEVNHKLWNIEDLIRIKESKKEFDNDFIELARSVYFTNDQRANIKKQINILTSSNFVEEKSYEQY